MSYKTNLGEHLTFKNGKTSPERNDSWSVPVFGSNGQIGFSQESNNPRKTIVIGRVGSYCGSVHFSNDDCWVSDNAIACHSKNADESYFWKHCLIHLNLNKHRGGSGQPLLNQTTLKSVEVVIPKSTESRIATGQFLELFDSKISNNNLMNQTLEKIAQRIFKSWFIDFEPVNANKEGLPFDGLSPEIQALFPSEFEGSELGMIPKGWEVNSLASLAKLETKSAKPNKEPEKKWTHYSIPAFDDNQYPTLDLGEMIKSNKYQMFENTVLVSKLNPRFKRIWFPKISNADNSSVCSTEFMQFLPLNPNWFAYLLSYVASSRFQNEMLKTVSGTTGSRQRAQPKEVAKMPALIPELEVLDAFAKAAQPLLGRYQENSIQINTLKRLRDRLLPKLISGQISVSEAKQELAEAV